MLYIISLGLLLLIIVECRSCSLTESANSVSTNDVTPSRPQETMLSLNHATSTTRIGLWFWRQLWRAGTSCQSLNWTQAELTIRTSWCWWRHVWGANKLVHSSLINGTNLDNCNWQDCVLFTQSCSKHSTTFLLHFPIITIYNPDPNPLSHRKHISAFTCLPSGTDFSSPVPRLTDR